MTTRKQMSEVPVAEIAVALLAQPEVIPRARVIADTVAALLPGAAAVVYVIAEQDNPEWSARATAGEVTVSEVIDFNAGTLGIVAEKRSLQVFEGASLQREDFFHLDIRRTALSLAYTPLIVQETLVGAIELVCYEQAVSETALQSLNEIAELASPAIATALHYESERNVSLQSISRVAQMYDLEKVFNATLQMNELLELIAKKFAEVLKVQGVNLWMVLGDGVQLVSQGGADGTVSLGVAQKGGEGIAGNISDSGESVLIDDSDDDRLRRRNSGVQEEEEGAVFSLLGAPLMEHESLVGVVEAVNRLDGLPFDEDDQFLLANICETASNALHNAWLLEAERKVEILHTLVSVSHEITSTLNLERMLQTIVNAPQAVIPYERAAIALDERGRCKLGAVTGLTQVNADSPEVAPLYDILRWAMLTNDAVHVTQRGDHVDADREETRAKFQKYFEESGMRGFYVAPLRDDTGLVGVLALESSDPDFLSTAHLEILQVIAGQATVALRNAQMYKDVPFISVLEPVLARKRKFLAMGKRRRALMIAAVAAVVLFLAGFPMVLRVEGDAVVAPAHSAKLQPEIEGVVGKVYVREGDRVTQGQVIADLVDWEPRIALSQSQARYQSALLQMNRALAANDGTEAGVQRVQSDYWKAEVMRAQERLDRSRLRSPIDGVVATPDVEAMVGRRLQYGDTFAEIVDTSHTIVDVAVDDTDIGLVRAGEHASVKLNSFPMKILRGDVVVVSPQGTLVGDSHVFYARVAVSNPDGTIHAGMEGRAKVRTGWYPAGYALFRTQLLWFYSKLWAWFGV